MHQFSMHASTCSHQPGPTGFSPHATSFVTQREYDPFSPSLPRWIPNPPAFRICQHCGRQTSASTCEGCGAPGGGT